MKEKIKAIYFDDGGVVNATEENPIEMFLENGEMAKVKWYRCGKSEFNGKYIVQILYY